MSLEVAEFETETKRRQRIKKESNKLAPNRSLELALLVNTLPVAVLELMP